MSARPRGREQLGGKLDPATTLKPISNQAGTASPADATAAPLIDGGAFASTDFDALPRGFFSCVLADPPWRFQTYDRITAVGRGKPSYESMSVSEIETLPVADLTTPNATLFLWVLAAMLPAAFDVIRAWQFEYKTIAFVWGKIAASGAPAMGQGFWTRQGAEVCLLATRGKPQRFDRAVRQLILAPRPRRHSEKPARIRDDISRLVRGPRLELFARQRMGDWFAWGNQLSENDSVTSQRQRS